MVGGGGTGFSGTNGPEGPCIPDTNSPGRPITGGTVSSMTTHEVICAPFSFQSDEVPARGRYSSRYLYLFQVRGTL